MAAASVPGLGAAMPRFSLPDVTTGTTVSAEDFADRPALLVAFICNHCPYVIHLRASFVEFARAQQAHGMAVVAISANSPLSHPQDGPAQMAVEAKRSGFSFPYLFDESQQTAKAFGAVCTPEFYLWDAARKLVYHGRYDGSRPGSRIAVSGDELGAAVVATLAGRAVAGEQIPSAGCSIKWNQTAR
jgi:peroxiredoxin